MNTNILLLFLLMTLSTNLFGQTSKDLPNIIFILADDLGYGSLNVYGADTALVRTPALNRLSEEGLRFTNAHAPASICSPTRYGILMGEYPWRSRLKFGVVNSNDPLLPDAKEATVADVLKDKGYTTAMIGKWHLGYGDKSPVDYTGKLTPGPFDLGFDYHFGCRKIMEASGEFILRMMKAINSTVRKPILTPALFTGQDIWELTLLNG